MQLNLRKLNPFLRLLCVLQLANGSLIALKLYATSTGHWKTDPISLIAFIPMIIIAVGLVMVDRMAKKRIAAIADLADRIISTGDVSLRIHDPYQGSEEQSLISVLNRMLDEIEQHLQAIRTVSDNIAHDLRHPLTRLRNHIEELRVSVQDEAECAEGQQKLTQLVSECDQLLSTFSAILRISNIESARRHGGFKEVNLNAVMQDVLELYEPLAGEKNITLALDAESTRTIGDKDLLFQAFANLVDNAIKYTPENGAITISLMPEDKGGRITIADTGRGIPNEHKPNVFRRFYRADACRSQPGTGLGLSLVRAIVQLHQGSITLEDNQPTGLIVTVRL